MDESASKRCSVCGEVKPLEQFNAHPKTLDRRQSACRECDNRRSRERYQQHRAEELERMRRSYRANREARLEQNRNYRQANQEEISQRRRQNYEANREVIHEQRRRSYQAHQDERREDARRYRETHPETVREYRDRIQNQVLAHYGTACACCGSAENLAIDHVGGGGAEHRRQVLGHTRAGLPFYKWLIRDGFPQGYQTLCKPCNSSKGERERCSLDHGG